MSRHRPQGPKRLGYRVVEAIVRPWLMALTKLLKLVLNLYWHRFEQD